MEPLHQAALREIPSTACLSCQSHPLGAWFRSRRVRFRSQPLQAPLGAAVAQAHLAYKGRAMRNKQQQWNRLIAVVVLNVLTWRMTCTLLAFVAPKAVRHGWFKRRAMCLTHVARPS